MSTAPRRLAVILRGPPAVGKSAVRDLVIAHVPPGESRFINLDAHWAPGEPRYIAWPHRYADILLAHERVLVCEMASGEPTDWSFPGATRAAYEWIDTLKATDREVLAFHLLAELDDAINRVITRNGANIGLSIYQIGMRALHTHNHTLVRYPSIPGFNETQIMTTGKTAQQVADEVIHTAKL